MRALVVAVILSLFATVPLTSVTVTAAPVTYRNLDLGAGDNWASTTFTTPVKCLDLHVFGNLTGIDGSLHVALWLKSPDEWVSVFFWGEDASTRVVVESSVTGRVAVGSTPYFSSAGISAGLPTLCTFGATGWTHVAYAIPGAIDGRLRLGSASSTAGTDTTGDDAFAASARTFTGTAVEAESSRCVGFCAPVGASAVLVKEHTVTVPQGMVAFFTAATANGFLSVQGDNGFSRTAQCTGSSLYLGLTCAQTTASSFAHVGEGTAPAGDYTFRYTYGAAPEGIHLFLVGAPVNW